MILPNAKDTKIKDAWDVKNRRTEARPRSNTGSMADKSTRTKATPRVTIGQTNK